jgi:hypothetical protein
MVFAYCILCTKCLSMQQYYETLVTLRGGHTREGLDKRRKFKKLNTGDILSIQQWIQKSFLWLLGLNSGPTV